MPPWLHIVLGICALVGQVALGVKIFNRVQATALPRPMIKGVEILMLGFVPTGLAWLISRLQGDAFLLPPSPSLSGYLSVAYTWLCTVCGLAVVPVWIMPRLTAVRPAALVSESSKTIDLTKKADEPLAGDFATRAWLNFPGNQIFQLAVTEKTLRLPRLPAELEGLRIVHLTDLHITGDTTQRYYREIVEAANALDADVLAMTGDILENEACLPWIAKTLAKAEAKFAKVFIAGNHELKLPDVDVLRFELYLHGWLDLGSRCRIIKTRDVDMLYSGVELPWFGRYPTLHHHEGRSIFRLLLSHTPDNYAWAREAKFDLMLAGHVHGGQIRFPITGPLVVPSRFGFRYAAGVFNEPPTVLHVSRGLGGTHPIRLNCQPELALLTLTR